VSPVGPAALPINQLLDRQRTEHIVAANGRFQRWDPLCELLVSEPLGLERWLYSVLPQVTEIVQDRTPNQNRLRAFRESMQAKRTNIDSLFIGKGR
jgi:hypothetical protein